MNPRMLVEFVDGSKTMVEMAAIANATGLVPDKPGMHGPAGDARTSSPRCSCPQKDGGVLSRRRRRRLFDRQGRGARRVRRRRDVASAHLASAWKI